MKLQNYLRFMDIKSIYRKCAAVSLICILCICTAMRCKKDDYIFHELKGLENSSVQVVVEHVKQKYTIGDIITIKCEVRPSTLNMKDFSQLAYFDMANDYHLYEVNGETIAHGAFSFPLGDEYQSEGFNEEKSKYSFLTTLKLEKAGKYRLQKSKKFLAGRTDGEIFFSTLNITVYSGIRKPRGYTGAVPMYFINNAKTYMDIHVE